MNWFKWFICWFNKRHIFMNHYYDNGKSERICIRCGYVVELKEK